MTNDISLAFAALLESLEEKGVLTVEEFNQKLEEITKRVSE